MSVIEKKRTCGKLQEQLEVLEKETAAKLAEMDKNNKDMQVLDFNNERIAWDHSDIRWRGVQDCKFTRQKATPHCVHLGFSICTLISVALNENELLKFLVSLCVSVCLFVNHVDQVLTSVAMSL